MESNLIFKSYKFRCSALGHLMGGLNSITKKQLEKISELEARKAEAETNPKKALTPNMESLLLELIAKRDAEDVLPQTAKSYLDETFRDLFWKRKRHLSNKYIEKGLMTEQDILHLASVRDNEFYTKNEIQAENEFICGSWDNFQNGIVRDTKSNYDLETFDKAESTMLYEWQLRGYSWLIKDYFFLDELPQGELIYGLVNSPIHHLQNDMNKLFYQVGQPTEENENWLLAKEQVERNHIFDTEKFKSDYPHYIFESRKLDFSIPEKFRIKSFQVEVNENHIEDIKRRVLMARLYLCEKEVEFYK